MWPDDDDAWTQTAVAHELGVSRYTVKMAIEESAHIIRSNTLSIPQKSEQKCDSKPPIRGIEKSVHIIRSDTLNIPSDHRAPRQ